MFKDEEINQMNNEIVKLRNISDVSILEKYSDVYGLDLLNCVNISDVSNLGNVHTLNLSGCINLTDVSMLGNVHTLIIKWNLIIKKII